MKPLAILLFVFLPGLLEAGERLPLRVLMLSNQSERASDFERFLNRHFDKVVVTTHDNASWPLVKATDVVLLDWSQSETNSVNAKSPLGPRESWAKPTVLLGSAGHLLASPWEIIGGSG